ncbi:MAG: hypothetical protein HY716_02690 [Planctomycetes bacterium]|nr:hypothetical protein [Planctomycetota bacterium]
MVLALGAALALTAGCNSWDTNPYDTAEMVDELEKRDAAAFELQRLELATRLTSRTHDVEPEDHELNAWRASVLNSADPALLDHLKLEGEARIDALRRLIRELEAEPDILSAGALTHLRTELRLELRKKALIESY